MRRIFQTTLRSYDLQARDTISFVIIIPYPVVRLSVLLSIFSKLSRVICISGGRNFQIAAPRRAILGHCHSLSLDFLYSDGKLTLIGSTSIALMRKVVESVIGRSDKRREQGVPCMTIRNGATRCNLFSLQPNTLFSRLSQFFHYLPFSPVAPNFENLYKLHQQRAMQETEFVAVSRAYIRKIFFGNIRGW